jgi:translocation and assembly module TamB
VGRVELDQLVPASADLKLTLHHFPLARTSFLRSYVDGEVAVVGPINGLALSGDITLQDTRVRLPEADDPLLREIHVVARSSSDGATTNIVEGGNEPGPYEHATFDLRLQIPRGTWVKGRGANLDLTGELALRKRALEAPRYLGEVKVVRGTYTLHGRRFAIRRGTVSFDGSTDANPQIDIEAIHRVSDIEIIAYLTGRALDPVLRLESEPVLPESEVLHYLVFGRSSDEATDADLQIGAAAGALAAGVALSQVTPMLEEALPIDTLEFLVPTDQSDGAIGIGKYVHEDVYIRYGRTLSRDPVDEVSIELRLDDHWSVESQASSDENAGADLIWSYDF